MLTHVCWQHVQLTTSEILKEREAASSSKTACSRRCSRVRRWGRGRIGSGAGENVGPGRPTRRPKLFPKRCESFFSVTNSSQSAQFGVRDPFSSHPVFCTERETKRGKLRALTMRKSERLHHFAFTRGSTSSADQQCLCSALNNEEKISRLKKTLFRCRRSPTSSTCRSRTLFSSVECTEVW